ncbi:alpha/beta hydrolase [Bradyrhizobium sp. Leo170]|uniref:alpha/beta fold hydrolase n=1 Tax=Bradyrhizobium sp. Leo170 TaxID=1571199 RepID=UPI001FE0D71D|nr:alpha/beta hydrolase [Bradyrhizobium sp. Leo170]
MMNIPRKNSAKMRCTMELDRRSLLFGGSQILLAGAAATGLRSVSAQEKLDSAEPTKIPAGMSSRFVDVNGIRMHYVAMGSGPVLVLLHGWPETWFAWRGIMPRLARKFTVVAADLRGSGLSERTDAGYDKQTIAEDIRALIAHLGPAPAHVVGHDMGGKAAYVLAHLYPQAVSRLVLVDCLLPGTENLDALRGGAWHYGFHMASEFPEMLTMGRERDYIRAQIRAWSHNKMAISEDAKSEFAYHYARPGGMTAGFNYYRALRQDARFAEALRGRKLTPPVMTITGRYGVGDKLAESLRGQAADLTSVVAEDSGHFVAEEVPDFFCEKLETFLVG